MKIPVYIGGEISGKLSLPGSKSLSNRLLLMAALSSGEKKLSNLLISDDTRYMAEALRTLGFAVDLDEISSCAEVSGGKLPSGSAELFVGNAGTAMRFLTSFLALGHGVFVIDGDSRMRERPIRDLVEAIRDIGGAKIDYLGREGCPPLRITSEGLNGGKCKVLGKNSSQYVSSLLMAAPYMKQGLELQIIEGLSSKPYFEMTMDLMERFGVKVSRLGDMLYSVAPGEYVMPVMPREIMVEPDASSATYFMALPLLFGGSIEIVGLGKSSLQGDVAFADVLSEMGAKVDIAENSIKVSFEGKMRGVDVDMNAIPDTVPTLAALALFAEGPTKIRNIANLRIKECDRISAISAEIKKIGGLVKETYDGLEIFPQSRYNNGLIETYRDHRIAMAFFLVGLKVDGISLENPGCVSKSFPEYYRYMGNLLNLSDLKK